MQTGEKYGSSVGSKGNKCGWWDECPLCSATVNFPWAAFCPLYFVSYFLVLVWSLHKPAEQWVIETGAIVFQRLDFCSCQSGRGFIFSLIVQAVLVGFLNATTGSNLNNLYHFYGRLKKVQRGAICNLPLWETEKKENRSWQGRSALPLTVWAAGTLGVIMASLTRDSSVAQWLPRRGVLKVQFLGQCNRDTTPAYPTWLAFRWLHFGIVFP